MNKDTHNMLASLERAGITPDDALALRRVAMTLHRWHELECGVNDRCIERDEETGRTYWLNSVTNRRCPTPDRETGALKRLDAIMAKYPDFLGYVQGDPRGAALYIVRKSDIPAGADIDAYYSRGIAVYK